MNILLVGEESAGIQTLRALARSKHRIVAVMASPSRPSLGGLSVWTVAENLGYPTWPAELVRDPAFATKVRSEAVDIILNTHSLFIINREVVSASRVGSFNMHPGPLPRYAGLNAVSWAIYRGETRHGVTLHQIVPQIDAGPIVYQAIFDLEASDTALTLTAKCVKAGVALILRLLEAASMSCAAIPLVPQDLTQREYFGAKIPREGRLSWALQAWEIVNFVRACDFFPFASPWGHPRTKLTGQEIAIVKASLTGEPCDAWPGTVGQVVGSGVYLACTDEWICVSKLLVGGRYLNSADVLRPGDRLEDGD